MFEPTDRPRLFGLPPGADFPSELISGLCARLSHLPPEAMAGVDLFVNTRRMQRRVMDLFAEGPARLLPRVRLLGDLGADPVITDLPPAVPGLRRRLEVAQLVSRLLERDPTVGPRSAAFDHADSLARLMDEMQGEGVAPDAIERLDVGDESGHWQRALTFVRIVARYFEASEAPDPEARQRRVVETLVARWRDDPPTHPVIVAGSTGSRGATALFMEAVARLPQGALVLPGLDFEMPGAVWDGMSRPMDPADRSSVCEDHPQYRYARLFRSLGVAPKSVARWTGADPVPARNRLISMALRPAPVTDQWMAEGPDLGDLSAATAGLALIEAPDPRVEALAIALRLRQAAEAGQRAALVTPDRTLTRRVAAALDRWRIEPDDSAGRPLPLTPPGRLLRQVAALMGQRVTPEALLALLKHPLVASGAGRGAHLRWTRGFELWLRASGPPFVEGPDVARWVSKRDDEAQAQAQQWAAWLTGVLSRLGALKGGPLPDLVAGHLGVTEALSGGAEGTGAGALWAEAAGETARAATQELAEHADAGGDMSVRDYAVLFDGVLSRHEVRDPVRSHPGIMIWGTLEARVQGADVVVLASLTDGRWPELPDPDPWLNRRMRAEAGLLLPERQIGLSAHDFQMAAGAREVIFTRSLRDAEAETVMSRWLNRLTNLMAGLPGPDSRGPEALEAMRARGDLWLSRAQALDLAVERAAPAPRPAPQPPVDARPKKLSVTEIERLVRDPYAIYARHVLGLRPLDPLRKVPDAAMKGTVLHDVMEAFARSGHDPGCARAVEHLLALADDILAREVPWPAMRQIWRARLARVAPWFMEGESRRRLDARPMGIEAEGTWPVPGTAFTLTGKADRIDVTDAGLLRVIDYKSGAPPTDKTMAAYNPQLMLEVLMAEAGAFKGVAAARVERIGYIGLGSSPKDPRYDVRGDEEAFHPDAALRTLRGLLSAFERRERGYAARRAMEKLSYDMGYDHLARYGEWDESQPPSPERVG